MSIVLEVWDWDAKGSGDFMGIIAGPNPFHPCILPLLDVPVWDAVFGRKFLAEATEEVKGRVLWEVSLLNGSYAEAFYWS